MSEVEVDDQMLLTDRRIADSPPRRHAARGMAGRLARTIRYYDANAEAYAAMVAGIDVTDTLSKFVALLPPGGRVLDAGCGAGRDLVHFRDAGLYPVGLDLSSNIAAIARRVSGCEVLVGDLSSPPSMAPFDGIWAMASLLHADRASIDGALASLVALLKPGGVLFSSVKRGSGEAVDDLGRFFTLYDEGQWAGRLQRAGLEVIEILGEPPTDGDATGSVSPGWISSLARRP